MAIKTHSAIIRQQHSPNTPYFHLNELYPTSTNVEAKRYPLRIIAWGLSDNETVSVHIARVQSLDNPHWALSDDDCCPCVIEPSAVANVQHMPYKQCGKPLVLTAENPTAHIDDAGTYYFEYHGTNSVIIDHYDDPIMTKNKLCGCDL